MDTDSDLTLFLCESDAALHEEKEQMFLLQLFLQRSVERGELVQFTVHPDRRHRFMLHLQRRFFPIFEIAHINMEHMTREMATIYRVQES